MTIEQIKQLEYAGGGYFRMPGPKGQTRPIVHGPELLKFFHDYIKQQESKKHG